MMQLYKPTAKTGKDKMNEDARYKQNNPTPTRLALWRFWNWNQKQPSKSQKQWSAEERPFKAASKETGGGTHVRVADCMIAVGDKPDERNHISPKISVAWRVIRSRWRMPKTTGKYLKMMKRCCPRIMPFRSKWMECQCLCHHLFVANGRWMSCGDIPRLGLSPFHDGGAW